MLLPLELKIILWVLVILAIGFVLLKNKRRQIGLLFTLVAAAGLWRGWAAYNKTNPDLQDAKADFTLTAPQLISAYETSDSSADRQYLGKVLEVKGNIKSVDKDEKGNFTIVLGDTTSLSSVRCSMDSVHNADASFLKSGSSVVVKGNCTGFNKDEMGLGSDVILNRCAVITKKD